MAEEPQSTGPHDEWLTEELARLRATGQAEPPKIVLIAGLQKHTGLGLREAKEVVEDYGRRNGLAWGADGPVGSIPWMVALLLAVVVTVYPLLRTVAQGEKPDLWSAAFTGVVTVVLLVLLVLEVRKYLKLRRAGGTSGGAGHAP